MIGDIDNRDQWWIDKWSKFSASQNFKLLSGGKSGELFGSGAKTYIKQKAIEKQTIYWENPKLEFVKPLLWGRRYEEPAFRHYQEATRNVSMRYFGTDNPIFLNWEDAPNDAGGSPDGFMGEGTTIHWGLELKCPENSSIHWDYLQLKDQYGLQDYCIEYYCQIQFLLMVTKAQGWHFASFDERFKDTKKRMKIIEVKPDKKFQDGLEIRVKQAIKERDLLIGS